MAVDLGDFLDELDEVANHVAMARYEDFPRELRRWFAVFDEAPPTVVRRIGWLMTLMPWASNESTLIREQRGMGNSQLIWPDAKEPRLSAQLNLLKEFAEGRIRAEDFAFNFFRTRSNNINETLHEMTRLLFEPHVAELRRYLIRNADKPVDVVDMANVPASDRIVQLDHNSAAHVEADKALGSVEESLQQANDGDPEEKQRVVAEVSAARRLLQAGRVRVGALIALLGGALAWVASQFAETAAGKAADWAIQKMIEYLPLLSGLL